MSLLTEEEIEEITNSVGDGPLDYSDLEDADREAIIQLALSLDRRLAEHHKLLEGIPECPLHGRCLPHAKDWVNRVKLLIMTEEEEGLISQLDEIKNKLLSDQHIGWHHEVHHALWVIKMFVMSQGQRRYAEAERLKYLEPTK